MASTIFNAPILQLQDANGDAYSGAKAFFYLLDTTTESAPYQNADLSTPHANPVVADATGAFAPIYLDPAIEYKVVLKDSSDTILETIESVNPPSPVNLAAYAVGAEPSDPPTGMVIWSTNGNAGSACLAAYDGTNWKVIALGSTVSAT